MFPTIKSSNAADEKGMLYYQKGNEKCSALFCGLPDQYPAACVTSVSQKQPDSLPSHSYTPAPAPTASAPKFP